MSINNSYKIQIIESDGESIRYNFEFFIHKKEDLKIKIIDEKSNITELQYGNDYVVENQFDYYNGGYFNLAEVQKEGVYIVIYRETDINQKINFMSLQAISPMNLTKMFDKLTIICQELKEQFYRSVKFDFADISIIDQDKPLDESNIKNIDEEINKSYIVAITLKYNQTTQKWELSTSKTDPDDKKEQATEEELGVVKIARSIDVKEGEDDLRAITPKKLKEELDDRQATDEEIEIGEDIKKYVNPKQLKSLNNKTDNIEDTTNYILSDGIAGWIEDFEYKKFSIVTYIEGETVNLYYSLFDKNKRHLPTDKNWWYKIIFGSFIEENINNLEIKIQELKEELIAKLETTASELETNLKNTTIKINNNETKIKDYATAIKENIKSITPDDNVYEDFSISESDSDYTMPYDGWVFLRFQAGAPNNNETKLVEIKVVDGEGVIQRSQYQRSAQNNPYTTVLFPCKEGQIFEIYYESTVVFEFARFYRATGILIDEPELDKLIEEEVLPPIEEEIQPPTEEEIPPVDEGENNEDNENN